MPLFGRHHDDDDDLTDEDLALQQRIQANRNAQVPPSPGGGVLQNIAAIRGIDPAFSLQDFLSDMQLVVALARQCWLAKTPERLQPLVDPALWQAWGEFWPQWPQQSHFVLRGQLPADIYPVQVTVTEAVAQIKVLIVTQAPQVAGGLNYREVWTMTGVRLSDPTVTTADVCPTCGAPFTPTEEGTCSYCGAVVRAAGFHWRLADVASGDGITRTAAPEILAPNIDDLL